MVRHMLSKVVICGLFVTSSVAFGDDDGAERFGRSGDKSSIIRAQIQARQKRMGKSGRKGRRFGRGGAGNQNGGGVIVQPPVVDVPVIDMPVVDVPVVDVPVVDVPVVDTPVAGVTFKQVQAAMNADCTSCHGDFAQYQVLKGMVNTSSPTSSRLYKTIYGGHGGMSDADVSMVLKWIEGGALNN
jgi:hypothetical protein